MVIEMTVPQAKVPDMADVYELILSADLPADLSRGEVAELRWHLGTGRQPDTLTIVTDFAEAFEDETGQVRTEQVPYPVLARREPAWRIGGVVSAEFQPRDDGGWALTARQEIHPDGFPQVTALLRWLEARAVRFSCQARHYENEVFTPVRNAEFPDVEAFA